MQKDPHWRYDSWHAPVRGIRIEPLPAPLLVTFKWVLCSPRPVLGVIQWDKWRAVELDNRVGWSLFVCERLYLLHLLSTHPPSPRSLCCHLIRWLSCTRNSCPWLGPGWSLFPPVLPLSANEGRRWGEGGRVRLNLFLSSFTPSLRFHESTALGYLGDSGESFAHCMLVIYGLCSALSWHFVPPPFSTYPSPLLHLMVFPGSGLIDCKGESLQTLNTAWVPMIPTTLSSKVSDIFRSKFIISSS